MSIIYPTSKNCVQKTLDAQLLTGATASVTLNNVVGIQNKAGVFVVDRVDANNNLTPSKREYVSFTGVSGSTLTGLTRNADGGGSDQDHAVGAIVEFVGDVLQQQAIIDTLGVQHGLTDGVHTSALVTSLKATGAVNDTGTSDITIVTPKSIADSHNVPSVAPSTSGNIMTSNGTDWVSSTPTAAASFWTLFSGAYASGTTLTVAGVDMTGIFKKGVSLKWLSSADALKVGKVVSSSFSTNTTITIVGSTAEAGDKTFYYGADVMSETFIVAGNQSTGTNVSKTWTAKTDIYPISVDAVVSTAGTTNSTDYDVNDDGTTIIATKPAIASTATTDLDNVVSAPTTAIAVNSVVTVDIDAASTTQAIDGYVTLFFIPSWWINRT